MIRLILRLLGIKDFEVCSSCETLKSQLRFANEEKKELTDTLLSILKPKVYESPPIELNPIQQTAGIFSRRRSALEARDREEAKILLQGRNIGKPDIENHSGGSRSISVEELEKELGIEEKEGT